MHSAVDVSVADDIVLVSVTLDNTAPVAQRVRLRNRLDGPLLPPRRRSVPEPGWDDEGFDGSVPANSTLTLGFACLRDDDSETESEADLDPSSVVALDVLGREPDSDAQTASTPSDVVRELGSSRPPADALPDVPLESTLSVGERDVVSPLDSTDRRECDDGTNDGGGRVVESPECTDADVAVALDDGSPDTNQSASLPISSTNTDLESFLATVERRISLAERLDGASVREAASVLDASTQNAEAVESLDADRTRLRRLADRATKLADRAADADPDVDALRRVV